MIFIDLCEENDENTQNSLPKINPVPKSRNQLESFGRKETRKEYKTMVPDIGDFSDDDAAFSSILTQPPSYAPSKYSKATNRIQEKKRFEQEKKLQKEMRGNFKHQEIGLIMSQSLSEERIGIETGKALIEYSVETPYSMHRHESSIQGLIRWTHRPISKGAHGSIGEPNVSVLPYYVVFYPVEKLVENIAKSYMCEYNKQQTQRQRSENFHPLHPPTLFELTLEYEYLVSDLDGIMRKAVENDACPVDSKLAIVLVNADNAIANASKRVSRFKPFSHTFCYN